MPPVNAEVFRFARDYAMLSGDGPLCSSTADDCDGSHTIWILPDLGAGAKITRVMMGVFVAKGGRSTELLMIRCSRVF